MANWQTVFKTDKLYRAEIVKDCLKEYDIQPIVVDKKDSAYQWGYYEIKVATDEVLVAIKIIENDIKFK